MPRVSGPLGSPSSAADMRNGADQTAWIPCRYGRTQGYPRLTPNRQSLPKRACADWRPTPIVFGITRYRDAPQNSGPRSRRALNCGFANCDDCRPRKSSVFQVTDMIPATLEEMIAESVAYVREAGREVVPPGTGKESPIPRGLALQSRVVREFGPGEPRR